MYNCIQDVLTYSFNIQAVPLVDAHKLELSCDVEALDEQTSILSIKVKNLGEEALELQRLTLEWAVPLVDMHGLYFGGSPTFELSHLPFFRRQRTVAANTGFPYIALSHRDGRARAAFGLLDQQNEVTLHSFLNEQTRCYHFTLDKPGTDNGQTLVIKDEWTERLFISSHDLGETSPLWFETLAQYRNWVDEHINPNLMPVPGAAFDPVFCSWTAIHHDVSHDWLIRNLTIAKDLGFKTLITDDGWFLPSDKGLFGDYRHVGDWTPEPSKFPDFKAHVAEVKALGFRYLLWVAPFMIGFDNAKAETYKHLLTSGQARERFHNLSPWKDETKVVVTRLLTELLETYDLDGFKIDFIDSLKPTSERTANSSKATLGERMFETLKHVMNELQKTKPELLIELRNSYTNLASRSYGNLFRSSDVPVNPGLNRWQAVLLRLLAPDRAIHTDPGLWHPEDSDENVAVHLINLLAAVPMVSIELDVYPELHLRLLHTWIGFYNEHKDTLVRGSFDPVFKNGSNPLIRFSSAEKTIIALYDDVPITLDDAEHIWLLNASTQAFVWLENATGSYNVNTRDKFGKLQAQAQVRQPRKLEVEIGGSLELRKPKK